MTKLVFVLFCVFRGYKFYEHVVVRKKDIDEERRMMKKGFCVCVCVLCLCAFSWAMSKPPNVVIIYGNN